MQINVPSGGKVPAELGNGWKRDDAAGTWLWIVSLHLVPLMSMSFWFVILFRHLYLHIAQYHEEGWGMVTFIFFQFFYLPFLGYRLAVCLNKRLNQFVADLPWFGILIIGLSYGVFEFCIRILPVGSGFDGFLRSLGIFLVLGASSTLFLHGSTKYLENPPSMEPPAFTVTQLLVGLSIGLLCGFLIPGDMVQSEMFGLGD
jgi:hypothetical protein